VSNTPSPTVMPWSSAETSGASGSWKAPSTWSSSGAAVMGSASTLGAARRQRDEPGGLELGLLPLPLRVAPPRDPGAGPEPQQPLLPPEGADPDGEPRGAAVGVHPADLAAVGTSRCGLEPLDHP